MIQNCRQCQAQFEITSADLEFYQKVSPVLKGKCLPISAPTLCPLCRQQRRQARRNERKLYNRKCDATGKQIIALYPSDSPYQVYESKLWWSDETDAKKHGRDFDFTRPFFEQFYELQLTVPRPNLFNKTVENSEYTNHADQTKDCYLIMNGGLCENCLYGNWIVRAKDCVDCSFIESCELCYQVSFSSECYNCKFCSHIDNCTDSYFLFDCKNVKNAALCVGLRNREYCLLNKQYSPEEYKIALNKLELHTQDGLTKAQQLFQDLRNNLPQQASFIINSEQSSGNNIVNSKDAANCFYIRDCNNVKNCFEVLEVTDGYDVYEAGIKCELLLETHATNRCYHTAFSSASYDNQFIYYCDLCHNSKNLFGCIGLKNAEHCILNKQFSKEEYEVLVAKIITHMQSTNEWGEFFPIAYSPFPYNDTQAQETFALNKDTVKKNQWPWRDESTMSHYQGESVTIPNTIAEVDDSFCQKILTCKKCQKNYRIIKQELVFYRNQNLPVPQLCIECRHQQRTAEINQIKLRNRECIHCHNMVESTYSVQEVDNVICRDCFQKHTY